MSDAASKREILAWASYDFANSGYSTVVLTTIYSAYFVSVIAVEESLQPGTATLLWTLSIAASNLIVLIGAPLLGAIADYRASKKQFLLVCTVVCVLATAGLAYPQPGDIGSAMLLIMISAVAFACGENLIAAFLPELASTEQMGRISGYGWSFGYFGGLLTLACCLAYISFATERNLSAQHYVPVSLLMTAVIFMLATIPTFLFLRERAVATNLPHGMTYWTAAFGRVRQTLAHYSQLQDLYRFLLCLTLFQAGVATVVVIAAIYAQEVMGFSSQQLITLIMVVNLTAALGAFGFGHVQDRIGSIPALAGALSLWIAAIGLAYFSREASHIWITGNLIGLAMGATQAGGRALIGRFTPIGHSAEFFGLWGLAARAAAILGPLSYGLVSHLSGGDHRTALLATLTLFILGLALLLTVNEERGQQAKRDFSAQAI